MSITPSMLPSFVLRSATSDWQHNPAANVCKASEPTVRDVAASATSAHRQRRDAERTFNAVAGVFRAGTLRGHQPGLAGVQRGGRPSNKGAGLRANRTVGKYRCSEWRGCGCCV